MKGARMWTTLMMVALLLFPASKLLAATDGHYQLTEETPAVWDGTFADRLIDEIVTPTDEYKFNYGDEGKVVFDLPWSWNFEFYGIRYTQIIVDTDGSIWFGTGGGVNSYPLATTGPVVSAWNSDLSSYAIGGIFVQHKTNPERVVVEWQTETFLDQGLFRPNNFEVVLYSDGKIQLNYNSFEMVQGVDFGSGISSGDGSNFISVTTNYGDVQNLAGRSFLVEEIIQPGNALLEILFTGDGEGTVSSTPSGINSGAKDSAQFPIGTEVTLTASALVDTTFTGWSGACSGISDCVVTLNANASVTANFAANIPSPVLLESTQGEYSSIQSAYDGTLLASDTIKVKAGEQASGPLVFDKNVTLKLEGGYDNAFHNVISDSSFSGTLTISGDPVTIMNLIIK